MATFGTFVSGQVLTAAELNGAGAWQDFTPTWTQSATITKTVNWARYTQLNKLVIGSIKMTATSAGTASNAVLVGLPVTASANNYMIGTAVFQDESATPDDLRTFMCVFNSTTTIAFRSTSSGTNPTQLLGVEPAITVASNDIIHVQFMYEAA